MADPNPNPNPNPNSNRDRDRISDLPDPLLTSIISFLPLPDAARTSALSPRFRHLWTFSSLNIDGRHIPGYLSFVTSQEIDDSVSTVGKILSGHRGPIHSFLLSDLQWIYLQERPRTVAESWIQTLSNRGVRHLNLAYNIPCSILSCQSLHSLELAYFDFFESRPEIPVGNLRELMISKTTLKDDVVCQIVSECRVLETLEVENCWSDVDFCIRSERLRKLRLDVCPCGRYELVVDAPKLEVLMLGQFAAVRLAVKVVNSPKLKLLGVLNAVHNNIQIGDVNFKPELPINVNACVHSIKTLAIKVNFCDFSQAKYVAFCIKHFPCLETLDILIDNTLVKHPRLWKWEEESSSDCLERYLKVVKLKGTVGHLFDVRFTKFLLQNARVLEVMSLHCEFSGMETWRETKLRELCSENRASLDAQVILTSDEGHSDEFSTWEGLF